MTAEPAYPSVVRVAAPTERRNPRSRDLDLMPTRDVLRLINVEDRGVPVAVGAALDAIAAAVDLAVPALRDGHRVHYFGAGARGPRTHRPERPGGPRRTRRWRTGGLKVRFIRSGAPRRLQTSPFRYGIMLFYCTSATKTAILSGLAAARLPGRDQDRTPGVTGVAAVGCTR
jgi:hypothetical protein